MAKMTYAESIDKGIEALEKDPQKNKEAIERLNDLKTALAKRNTSGAKKKTDAEKEALALMDRICALLEENGEMNPTDVGVAIGKNVQKATSLLTRLKDEEKVVSEKKKGKMMYRLADAPADADADEAVEVAEGE